jgi:hypothetical protein
LQRSLIIARTAGLVAVFSLLAILPFAALLQLSTGEPRPLAATQTTPSAIANGNVLPVPYFNQGDTDWCFLTSLTMVSNFFGKRVSPADMAKSLSYEPHQSVSALDVLLWRPDSSLTTWWPDLTVDHSYGIWDFDSYRAQIDAGSPVIASSYSLIPGARQGHTVVVVGYYVHNNEKYVYVNDPSGYLTSDWDIGPKWARVSWQQFEEFSGTAWSHVIVRKTGSGKPAVSR